MPHHPGGTQGPAVLFSAGLDSAVLLAYAVRENPGTSIQPIYVNAGLAWEAEERAMADRLLRSGVYGREVLELTILTVDMRDVYPPTHWAVRGEPPAYDTPDEDVFIEGRNIVLLSKTAILMARRGITRVLLGPLAGNPFPDATSQFFDAMAGALSTGLATPISIEAPFARLHKSDVIRLGRQIGDHDGETVEHRVAADLTDRDAHPDLLCPSACGACWNSECGADDQGHR